MKIKKNKLILLIVVLLSTRFFYLLPEYFFKSYISCENISVGIAFLWGIATLFSSKRYKIRYKYWGLTCYILLLVFTSAFQGASLYSGQSIISGLTLQKQFICAVFLYFPITKEIKLNRMSFQDIVDICFWCSCAHMFVYFVQYFAGSNHMFLSCYYTTPAMDSRVVRLRLYGSCYTVSFSLIFAIDELLSDVKIGKVKNMFFVIAATAFNFVILQGRSNIVGTVAVILGTVILKRKTNNKKFIIMLAAFFAIYYVWDSGYLQGIVNEYITTTGDTYSTIAVRIRSQEYYLSILNEHPMFGGGYADTSVPNAALLSGYSQGYYIGDNGIYGFLFRYGLSGLLWAIPMFISFVYNGFRLRMRGSVVVLTKFLLILVGIVNSASWFDGFGVFYTILFMVYIDTFEKGGRNNENSTDGTYPNVQ